MSTLYARIHPKRGVARFFRCGTAFTQAWQKLEDVDAATAKRLRAEQMLEVTDTKPKDLDGQEEQETSTATPALSPGQQSQAAAPEEIAVRLQAIRDAVAKLGPADQALWTGSGKPKTEAISAILGWNVSAVERDNALAPGGAQ